MLGVLFPAVKGPGREAEHFLLTSSLRMRVPVSLLPLYACMARTGADLPTPVDRSHCPCRESNPTVRSIILRSVQIAWETLGVMYSVPGFMLPYIPACQRSKSPFMAMH